MLQRIHYIANNALVLSILSDYLQTQGYECTEYSISERPHEVDLLLILEPFSIDSTLYTMSTAWKPWLMEFRPHTRLVVAAFAESRHSNCLNLLNLPDDLSGWLGKVRSVSDFPLIPTGNESENDKTKFVDTWTFDLIQSGYDLNAQMRKFMTGHEESKSFFAQISAMRLESQHLRYYQGEIKQGNTTYDIEKKFKVSCDRLGSLWNYFTHRWNYYSTVFNYVPYQPAINKIREKVEHLHSVMGSTPEVGQYPDIEPSLDLILQTMNKEMGPYILPERYW